MERYTPLSSKLLAGYNFRDWRYNAIMTNYRSACFNYHCRTGHIYWTMILIF